MGGEERAYELLHLMEQHPVSNTVDFELFSPPPTPFIEAIARAKPGFAIDISPHSHDIKVRRALGLAYSNEELEASIGKTLELGASRLEIYFMIGLPEQTPESVSQTLDYCEYLYQKFKADKRLFLFIGPLSPSWIRAASASRTRSGMGTKSSTARWKSIAAHWLVPAGRKRSTTRRAG